MTQFRVFLIAYAFVACVVLLSSCRHLSQCEYECRLSCPLVPRDSVPVDSVRSFADTLGGGFCEKE